MGKKLRPLEFYGYDYDSTMVKKDENEKDECFQISKVKELKNKKYIKPEEEESESGTTENN
jgi:hypothetical protein